MLLQLRRTRVSSSHDLPHPYRSSTYAHIHARSLDPLPQQSMMTIPLTKGYEAIVDDDKYEVLNKWKWYSSEQGKSVYAKRMIYIDGRQVGVIMHRLIMSAPFGLVVDHINGNGLDNRVCNLRVCTYSQNSQNQRNQDGTSSRFKGVTWCKNDCVWVSQIKHLGNRIYLGRFKSEESAAEAYNRAAVSIFGEYSRLNKL